MYSDETNDITEERENMEGKEGRRNERKHESEKEKAGRKRNE
jgi:hypothetical protein